jgi:tetratricopeptide (TPR) repeat protein
MNKYHISENNQVLGIYSLEELKQIPINNETLIWKKGMTEWKKASEVEELKILLNDKEIKKSLTFNADSELPPAIPIDLEEIGIFKNKVIKKNIQIPLINKSISPIYLSIFIICAIIIIGILFQELTKVTADRIPLSDIQSHETYQKKKGKECVKEYETLMQQNSKSCEVYFLLARLYHTTNLKNIDDVKIYLLKSLELKPTFFHSNLLLARIYYSEQNLAKAKNFITQAQNINKNDSNLQLLLAEIQKTETQLLEKEKILEDELMIILSYEYDIEPYIETTEKLAEKYQNDSGQLEYFVEKLKNSASKNPSIDYEGKNLNLTLLKQKCDDALALINSRKAFCSVDIHKLFLTNKYKNSGHIQVKISFIREISECSYEWLLVLDNWSVHNEYKLLTGFDAEMGAGVKIISNNRVF